MQIIEDFLTPEGLKAVQELCLKNTKPAEPFGDTSSELYKLCEAVYHAPCKNAMIWRVPSTTINNPHCDSKKRSTVFYPFDSDGPLLLYHDDHTLMETIEVKQNRLVAFESGKIIHSQMPPTKGIRYSVAFHWAVSS